MFKKKNLKEGAPEWLNQLGVGLWLRSTSQGSGIKPCVGLPAQREVCFSLCFCPSPLLSLFLKKHFIYLFMRDTERERQRHRQKEKQAPCRKPDMGLDPGSPGSHPGLQAALNRCATRAALSYNLKTLPLYFQVYESTAKPGTH